MQLIAPTTLLFSSMSWAVGSVLSRKWQMKVDPFAATAWEMIFAAIGNSVVALATGQYSIALCSLSAHDGSALPGGLRLVGRLHRVHLAAEACSTPKVATYAYVNPIVAVFLGWLILHERFDGYIFAGSVVIIAAVILVTTAKVHSGEGAEQLAGLPEVESEA